MTGKNTPAMAPDATLSYQQAGVDIEAGNQLVERIKPLASRTRRAGSMDGIGGFGGLFDLKACGYRDPILVSATDGVGTKLKLAFAADYHRSVGIDLVAMCVNDLLVQGAEPLFFLDYFATSGLNIEQAEAVIAGIAEGCEQAGCQLIGGETAEMPGMYEAGEYDLAGFAVGAAERDQLLPRKESLAVGDVVIGVGSSGLHSNGYSLFRRLVEHAGLAWDSPAPFDASQPLGVASLTPTRIYIRACLPLAQQGHIKAMAHITGGGLLENIPRVMPPHLGVQIDLSSWPRLPIHQWIIDGGRVELSEMLRTFNMGIGLVLLVAAEQADNVSAQLRRAGESVWIIGNVIPAAPDQPVVRYSGTLE